MTGIIIVSNLANTMEDSHDSVLVPDSYMIRFAIPYGQVRSSMRDIGRSTTPEDNESHKQALHDKLQIVNEQMNGYLNNLEQLSNRDPEEYEAVKTMVDTLAVYTDIVENKLIPAAMANKNEDVFKIISDDLKEPGIVLRNQIDILTNLTEIHGKQFVANANNQLDNSILILSILLVIDLAMMAASAYLITNSIVSPVRKIVKNADKISEGGLDVAFDVNHDDEIGVISRKFNDVASILKELIRSLDEMAAEHAAGNVNKYMDESKLVGVFKEVTVKVNEMVRGYVLHVADISKCIMAFGEGDFTVPYNQIASRAAVEGLRENLLGIKNEISMLTTSAIQGNLSARSNAASFRGSWAELLFELDKVLNAMITPIDEASDVLRNISAGDFNVEMSGEYKGDFASIKNSLNGIINHVSEYISDISRVLDEIANTNLNLSISKEYIGDFGRIKKSFEVIIAHLSEVIGSINNTIHTVLSRSHQIADISAQLSHGTRQQAIAVEDINTRVRNILNQADHSTAIAINANNVADKVQKNADMCKNDMQNILGAMQEINNASDNISLINRVISDISKQTNLLAVNAAVEAARAGQFGKGFAVVAEEVRSLADKSQNAAKETNILVEGTVDKINSGIDLTKKASSNLNAILSQVSGVSTMIEEITVALKAQEEDIKAVKEGVSRILDVTHTSSAAGEETHEAAEMLSSQAQSLKSKMSAFRLPDQRHSNIS
jgi:methyl-accepting chemotaxis protein